MKLLEFQQRVEAIKKDATNPDFKSNYFDINSLLAEIKPLLSELGLVITQPLSVINGKNVLKTFIADGEKVLLSSEVLLPEIQDPQKLGSAITYLRRYSLQSLLALQAEDDDGNMASKKVEVKEVVNTELDNIKKLAREKGFKGTTMKEFEMWIFSQTTYLLEEKSYNNILLKLK